MAPCGAREKIYLIREFSTGSFGWYVNGKASIVVDGKPIQCQVGMNITVVGSKELPRPNPPPAQA